MNIIESVILGIVEGLTEFLPVSSTGHLILAGHALGLNGEVDATFEVFIQLGAILAVVCLYHQRFLDLFKPQSDNAFSGFKGIQFLILTSLPAMVLGLLTHDFIKEHLFSPLTVIWALGIGGVVLILLERLPLSAKTQSINQLSWQQALMVGCFQCLSLWPGVSRAAATIMGGLFSGLKRSVATEYSFLAAVPIMLMATLYDLLKTWDQLHASDLPVFAIGFGVAFVSALLAIRFFIRLVQHVSMAPFGVYRILIALLAYWVFI